MPEESKLFTCPRHAYTAVHLSCHVSAAFSAVQVLSFYYRYLAAAKPLTDVVYGEEVRAPAF